LCFFEHFILYKNIYGLPDGCPADTEFIDQRLFRGYEGIRGPCALLNTCHQYIFNLEIKRLIVSEIIVLFSHRSLSLVQVKDMTSFCCQQAALTNGNKRIDLKKIVRASDALHGPPLPSN